jgi:hypothetical protein
MPRTQRTDLPPGLGRLIHGNNIRGAGGTLLDHRGGRAFVFNNNSTSRMGIQVREEYSDALSPVSYVGPNGPQYPQRVNGSYYWGNRAQLTSSPMRASINTSCSQCRENGLRENVDFWQDNPSFNGESGIGCGPLSSRPHACAVGTGYWATNQSCANLAGMVGDRPSSPISGKLYRCVSSNTWDSGVSPLTYPHPLRSPSPPAGVLPPKNLRISP